ncbi:MAG: sigma-70 family RNA polymerase sigma factor [Sandaracinus sp.]|nr:sigma-70 family RNA polymerase sigma factor [Sandaracinus sp.]
MHATMKPATPTSRDRAVLFGLCYRMLGCAADAEDVVQETFARLVERPPADLEAPLRPWLVRVATNLCLDALRRRKVRGAYFGPWLPGAVEDVRLEEFAGPEARLSSLDSARVAFLVALERLDPRSRAVLILRDAMGLDGAECADLLAISEGNVRVILHRARRTVADAEADEPSDSRFSRQAELLRRLLAAIALQDAATVAALLTEDAVSLHDANGEYTAAVRPLRGAAQILELYGRIGQRGIRAWAEVRYNGEPAIEIDYEPAPRLASRAVVRLVVEGDRVAAIHVLLAHRKLPPRV